MLSLKLQHEVARAASKHFELNASDVELDLTRDLAHGDFTTNVALKVASRWGVPPRQAADTLLEELKLSKTIQSLCSKVEVAGPGFINFTLAEKGLTKLLLAALDTKSSDVYRGKRVIVEYSSPNIAKPMHVGHIRSTIIGQAIGNLFQALGAKVVRINHLGDWGTQFGKLIAAYKLWGKREAVHKNPIDELLKLYVRFHEEMKQDPELEAKGQEEFRKLEQGNKQNRALWNWFKRESLREFQVLYKRLGVKFTHITGESFYEPMLKVLVAELNKRRIATKNEDGSVVVHLVQEGLPPALVQKSDGASLYATRDLAALKYRTKRYKPQSIFYVVGNEQSLHFDQVFAVAKRAGFVGKENLEHLKFGAILGEDGQKFATREGRLIRLEDVLAEAVTRARAVVDQKNSKLTPRLKAKVAEVVGIGAVKYNDLSQNRHTDITFSWDRMLSLDGNSAPYLQYSYVRLVSILRKSQAEAGSARKKSAAKLDLTLATEADTAMVRLLVRYPEAILRAAEERGPHLLAQYLYDVATGVNSYYQSTPVLKAGNGLRAMRLEIVRISAEVLKRGLALLGIGVVEQM